MLGLSREQKPHPWEPHQAVLGCLSLCSNGRDGHWWKAERADLTKWHMGWGTKSVFEALT